jgi:hypothetical protein
VFQVDFNAKSNGYIAIGYHYLNSKNHYSFEIGGDVVKFCQVRKALSGSFRNILKSEDETCGYEPGKWYTIMVQMFTPTTIIYMSKEGEGLAEILRVDNDPDFKFGRISLGTFKTQAAFTNIKMMPNEDVNIKVKQDPERKPSVDIDSTGGDDDDSDGGNKDDKNDGKPAKPNQPGGGSYSSDNEVKWDLCLETRSPEDRDKYCLAKFPNSKTAKTDCQVGYK